MSRVGKKPIELPDGVTAEVVGTHVKIVGPKGTLERDVHEAISVKVNEQDRVINVSRSSETATDRSLHGLVRSLVANMVEGVTNGYKKVLELHGVTYRATMQGRNLNLQLRFTHPVIIEPPDGISIECERRGQIDQITVSGINKETVGEIAARIRHVLGPEPYKGTGIRYKGEHVRRKAGKTGL
ncbi:MAG: 50S ribosomal protein L6 [Candidatus Hydrogenedentes bacterium]|nr:50S ribosomal protein L6 [Candidatus Hydrogenedentota bacterium]